MKIDKLILNFIWKYKGPRTGVLVADPCLGALVRTHRTIHHDEWTLLDTKNK